MKLREGSSVRRKVTDQDLVSGAIIKNGNAEHVVHRVSNGVVHYMDGCSDTLNIVLDFFEIEDKPTGIPTFDDDNNQQIGGTHYAKNDPIQFAKDNYPTEHLEGFYRINVDKYMARYDKKNGIEDIKKAKHYIEMLLDLKEQQNAE